MVSELCEHSKMPARWRRRKGERPSEILAAALKMFSMKGYSSTKLDEVAKEAGVSKGTLYLYFENKEALFKSVVIECVLPHIEDAEALAKQYSGSINTLLLQLLEQWQANVLESELSGISKMIIAEASNFPELAKFYMENIVYRARHFVADIIRLGIERDEFIECDVDYTARFFLTPMIFSAIWQHSLAPFDKNYDIDKYLKNNLKIFLRGIAKTSK